MLSWLILLIGVLLTLAFIARQRRNPSPGAWVGALVIMGVAVWVSSLVRPDSEISVPVEETTTVPAPQERPSPFSEDVPRGTGAPMTAEPAP